MMHVDLSNQHQQSFSRHLPLGATYSNSTDSDRQTTNHILAQNSSSSTMNEDDEDDYEKQVKVDGEDRKEGQGNLRIDAGHTENHPKLLH